MRTEKCGCGESVGVEKVWMCVRRMEGEGVWNRRGKGRGVWDRVRRTGKGWHNGSAQIKAQQENTIRRSRFRDPGTRNTYTRIRTTEIVCGNKHTVNQSGWSCNTAQPKCQSSRGRWSPCSCKMFQGPSDQHWTKPFPICFLSKWDNQPEFGRL